VIDVMFLEINGKPTQHVSVNISDKRRFLLAIDGNEGFFGNNRGDHRRWHFILFHSEK
jgi:hypothetical protein